MMTLAVYTFKRGPLSLQLPGRAFFPPLKTPKTVFYKLLATPDTLNTLTTSLEIWSRVLSIVTWNERLKLSNDAKKGHKICDSQASQLINVYILISLLSWRFIHWTSLHIKWFTGNWCLKSLYKDNNYLMYNIWNLILNSFS